MFPPRTETFTPQQALDGVETSLERLQTDHIDLFYIHWPRTGRDLRPLMEGLEQARSQGKIGGIGVSNFSVEQMTQVLEVGVIDAHQLCYNLFWRFPEKDIMPFCREHNIGLITYSSIAQGILTGKFGPEVTFPPDDQRAGTVLFDPAVYPHLHAATEAMKPIAQNAGRPLVELAIRWCAAQRGVSSVLVGARDAGQMHANARAMGGDVDAGALAALTQISDGVRASIPDAGNIFRFYP
jgi:aryl-alcohol dehydrogenase-like predicted oxidoreductase